MSKPKRSLEDGYITTGGAGYIPNNYGQGAIDYIRRKLYDNVLPWGYNDIPKRAYNAVIKDKKETDETRDRAIRDDLWATYLQIPKNARHTIDGGKVTLTYARYKPKGAVKGKPTYRFSKLTSPAEYGILAYAGQVPGDLNIEGGDYLPIRKNRVVYPNDINAFSELEGLGQFTVGRGHDKKGEYVSYYDSWDLGDTNSPYKDLSLGIGKPFNVYDRIYLDDYYGVSSKDRGGNYLPEIVVTGNRKKHKDGGSIHIAPSKRGTFTAAATKHGMGVQEFASRVLRNKDNYSPAIVKKANFARNAKRWKYGDGGNLVIGGELPEVTVTGYAPIRLTTYYPVTSKYPYTGHSKLDIPIDRQTWYNYIGEEPSSDRITPYMTIDKDSSAKDYNLVTNNCADATLNFLNNAFGTSEKPWLFTTPGDVRDYALKKLNGKLIENNDGSDTVLIPRNAKTAGKLSTTALNMFDKDLRGTAHLTYKGPFNYTKKYKNKASNKVRNKIVSEYINKLNI